VKAREYQQEKKAIKVVEEQVKFDYKIIRVMNALKRTQEAQEWAKKVEERRSKVAKKRRVKELVITNKVAKKSLQEKAVYTGNKAKIIALTMPKQYKVSRLIRPRCKALIKTIMVEQLQENVVKGAITRKSSTCTIRLL
jgi:hypothetical protein